MKLRLCIVTFLALLRVASAAGPSTPEIRGLMERMIVPSALPAGIAPADIAWSEITELIRVTPALNIVAPYEGTRPDWSGYIYWQEFSNRLLREAGLRFWREFPRDPRCWLWLQATLDRQPFYLNLEQGWRAQSEATVEPGFDAAARATWADQYRRLRSACIAAESAPEEFRVMLWGEAIAAPLEESQLAQMRQQPFDNNKIDYDDMGLNLQRLGETFPASDHYRIRSIAASFFRYTGRFAPAIGKKWREILGRNPNAQIRGMALSSGHLEDARATPMVMRFTAVDGREVDLAKLRGQVILLDFWAATWCGACKVQEPLLKEIYAKYKNQGFEIIGIACEMKPSDRRFLVDYVREHAMPWPQFFEGNGMSNDYAVRFGLTGLPSYLFLDRTGRLVAQSESSGGLRNLEAVVRRHLGLPPLQSGDETKQLGAKAQP